MTRILLTLVFLALPFRAFAITIPLRAHDTPIGLAAEADGTLWFVSFGVGRIRTTGEVERAAIPSPFAVERHAPIHVLRDGSVLVGSYNGVIARVDANMKATLIRTGDSGDGVQVFADGPDGSVLFGGYSSGWGYSGGFLGRLSADGVVTRTRVPVSIQAVAVGPDGTLYFTAHEGIYRMTATGAFEKLADCGCYRSWLVVTADGTLWFSGGRLPPEGTVIWEYYGGKDATLGPDGRVWIAGDSNSLRVLNADGSIQEIPFATSGEVPHSIVSTEGVIWYGVRGAVRSHDPELIVDLNLRRGDLVTIDDEQNCCFEGTHPVLAYHRRGEGSFLRRIATAQQYEYPFRDVYVLDADHILAEQYDDLVALLLDGQGRRRQEIAGAPETFGAGIVVDGHGTIYAVREDGRTNNRLLTFDPNGTLLRDISLAVPRWHRLLAIDLAADQCTLFYAVDEPNDAGGFIGRLNVCTGGPLPPFLENLTERPLNLRITRNGDVLVVYWRHLVRYDAAGRVLSELKPPDDTSFASVALDPDPRFIWIGSSRQLARVEWASGIVVERVPVYGTPSRISVVGEPRAARFPERRRALRP